MNSKLPLKKTWEFWGNSFGTVHLTIANRLASAVANQSPPALFRTCLKCGALARRHDDNRNNYTVPEL